MTGNQRLLYPRIYRFNVMNDNPNMIKPICDQWEYWDWQQVISALSKYPRFRVYLTSIAPRIEREKEKIIAALMALESRFQTDILYIYVVKEYRRQGVGLTLLKSYADLISSQREMECLTLEVRESNFPALKTYQKFGMDQGPLRKKYYKDGENAIIFSKKIT